MWLDGFGPRAENPRVGSSILSLATTKSVSIRSGLIGGYGRRNQNAITHLPLH
jgi:hypothetical protein